jgi:F-type H+-transporting ATPase subunit delta
MPLIEKRYAEALIGVAEQSGGIDDYQQELQVIVELFNSQQEFKLFLLNPEIKTDVKKTMITNVFGGRAKKELVNFLALLLDKGRIRNLPGILVEYVKVADRLRNTLNMTIISAAPLDDMQISSILEKYKRLYHATGTKINMEIDKNLIGGVKVRIGDKVVDGTITGRLESLKEILLKS